MRDEGGEIDGATAFEEFKPSTGRPRLTEKKHERDHDEHGEHQYLELVDDRDRGRLARDHPLRAARAGFPIGPVTFAATR
jgi:hypothetical protein